MADQTSDQAGSEGRTSRQEVASPCGFSLPFGPVLPSCVWVTSAVGKTVDGLAEGELRSVTGKTGPFHQHDDGFACVSSVGHPTETFSGSAELSLDPSRVPKRQKWQDPGIIPENYFLAMSRLSWEKTCLGCLMHFKIINGEAGNGL